MIRTPSPAMVVACVALVVALGGTGYAAIKLPHDSVGPAQLRANAVSGAKVRDGSLQVKDFAASQLPRGPRGPQGPAGTAGAGGEVARAGFASRDPVAATGSPLPIGTTPTDVLGLDVAAGTNGYVASSGVVAAPGPSRLVADAEAVIVNGDPTANQNAACQLVLAGASDQRVIGNYVNVLIHPQEYLAVPVEAGVDVDAGTYNVRLQCFGNALTLHRGNLVVTLTPR